MAAAGMHLPSPPAQKTAESGGVQTRGNMTRAGRRGVPYTYVDTVRRMRGSFFGVGSEPSLRSLNASVATAVTRWRFHRYARCRAACVLLQLLTSASALGHRRARSTRASPATYTLALPPLCAVQGCMCFAAASDYGVGSRPSPRSLETRASPAFYTLALSPL